MSELQYWDYLVIGGDFHGQVHNSTAGLNVLEIRLSQQSRARPSTPYTESEVFTPQVLAHLVRIHFSNGKRFAIATRESCLGTFDLDAMVLESGMSPL